MNSSHSKIASVTSASDILRIETVLDKNSQGPFQEKSKGPGCYFPPVVVGQRNLVQAEGTSYFLGNSTAINLMPIPKGGA